MDNSKNKRKERGVREDNTIKVIKTIIKKCLHCDYCIDEQFLTGIAKHYKDNNGKCHSYLVCTEKDNKQIKKENIIPSWCPLEDYKMNEKEKRGVREENSEGMSIEEAMEVIEMLDENDDLGGIYIGKPIKLKIINLLKRGEKYGKMWTEFGRKYKNYYSTFDVRKGNDVEYKYLDKLMNEYEQKYFPKEK